MNKIAYRSLSIHTVIHISSHTYSIKGNQITINYVKRILMAILISPVCVHQTHITTHAVPHQSSTEKVHKKLKFLFR